MKNIKMKKEILFKRLDNNEFIKLVYTEEKKYLKGLDVCRKWEKEGKIEIIPQDINEFIKTGIKT